MREAGGSVAGVSVTGDELHRWAHVGMLLMTVVVLIALLRR